VLLSLRRSEESFSANKPSLQLILELEKEETKVEKVKEKANSKTKVRARRRKVASNNHSRKRRKEQNIGLNFFPNLPSTSTVSKTSTSTVKKEPKEKSSKTCGKISAISLDGPSGKSNMKASKVNVRISSGPRISWVCSLKNLDPLENSCSAPWASMENKANYLSEVFGS